MCHHFFPFSIHFQCICINILFTLAMFWLLNVLNPISKFSNGSTEMLFRSFTIHIILILKPMHKFTCYLSHAYTHSNLIYRTAWFWVSMFLYLTAYGFFFSSQNVVHFIYLYRFIHYSTESNKPKKNIFHIERTSDFSLDDKKGHPDPVFAWAKHLNVVWLFHSVSYTSQHNTECSEVCLRVIDIEIFRLTTHRKASYRFIIRMRWLNKFCNSFDSIWLRILN